MNPFQIEVKLGTYQEALEVFRDRLQGAEDKVKRIDGGAAALRTAVARISDLHDVLEGERDEKLGMMDTEHQTAAAEFAKRYLHRAAGCVHSLLENSSSIMLRAQGELDALQGVVEELERRYKVVRAQLENLAEMIDRGDIEVDGGDIVYTGEGPAPAGVRPSMSLAEKRRQEDREECASGAPETRAETKREEPAKAKARTKTKPPPKAKAKSKKK